MATTNNTKTKEEDGFKPMQLFNLATHLSEIQGMLKRVGAVEKFTIVLGGEQIFEEFSKKMTDTIENCNTLNRSFLELQFAETTNDRSFFSEEKLLRN